MRKYTWGYVIIFLMIMFCLADYTPTAASPARRRSPDATQPLPPPRPLSQAAKDRVAKDCDWAGPVFGTGAAMECSLGAEVAERAKEEHAERERAIREHAGYHKSANGWELNPGCHWSQPDSKDYLGTYCNGTSNLGYHDHNGEWELDPGCHWITDNAFDVSNRCD
jgi:hypothetical protein